MPIPQLDPIEITHPLILEKGVNATIDFYNTLAINTFSPSDLYAFFTGIDSPYFNVVIDRRKNTSVTEQEIRVIEEYFSKHKAQWSWIVTQASSTSNLENLNFTLISTDPALYFDLQNTVPNVTNEQIIIREVENAEALKDWIIPIREGFPSSDNGEHYLQLNLKIFQNNRNLKHFIAYKNDVVAGAATLFLSGDSVMLHNLAVRPEARGWGIGKSLATHRMRIAQQLGYRHCFLDASEEGFTLHRALGLKIYGYTKIYIR